MAFGNVRARLASTLLQLANDFGRGEGEATVIEVDLRQEDLASLVGASRQTVNVEIRALAGARVIELTGRRMVLRDLAALRDLRLHERT
jgi:CRP-like cAMP-binding protein